MKFRPHWPRLIGLAAAIVPWCAIGLAVSVLPSCHKAQVQANVAPATEPNTPSAPTTAAAPTGPSVSQAPSPAQVIPAPQQPPTPEQVQTANDIEDNANARILAKQFEADPAALARQSSICGPADKTVDILYLTRKGPPTEDLRRLRMACIAKDFAERDIAAGAARVGVKNTRTL